MVFGVHIALLGASCIQFVLPQERLCKSCKRLILPLSDGCTRTDYECL